MFFDSAIVKMLLFTNFNIFFSGLFSLSQYLKTILGEFIWIFCNQNFLLIDNKLSEYAE